MATPTAPGIAVGFFAYPSTPANASDSINAAVKELNNSGAVSIRWWEELRVSGKVVAQDICRAIDDSSFVCADLTGLNPNVLFEVGYAIGRDKRIWVILDNSLVASKQLFDQFRILTTVGYSDYRNSRS